jgi:hypothetical protein
MRKQKVKMYVKPTLTCIEQMARDSVLVQLSARNEGYSQKTSSGGKGNAEGFSEEEYSGGWNSKKHDSSNSEFDW